MREQFLLDPEIHYLNHGSFGSVPRPVFETFLDWQRRIARQPCEFFLRELGDYFADARGALGDLVGADPGNLVFVPNATYGVNVVARSLQLGPGDEVLTTNHEYGACDAAWIMLAEKRGFTYRAVKVPLGLSAEDKLGRIAEALTGRTRALFLSHITSPTAMTLPVPKLCDLARSRDVRTVIDGAHAVGQIPLDLDSWGVDFYTSNAHKWLCSPIGSAFLYAAPPVQDRVEPLVASWGMTAETPFPYGSPYLDNLQWPGTTNVAAYLSVPAAIRFQREHDWDAVRARCHELLGESLHRIQKGTGMQSPYLLDSDYVQMAIASLPPVSAPDLHHRLLREFRVEVPIHVWEGNPYVRISVQGYNTEEDLRALERGLEAYFSGA